jgi:hypothetical protein
MLGRRVCELLIAAIDVDGSLEIINSCSKDTEELRI